MSSLTRPFSAPRAEVTVCSTSTHSASPSSARSTASSCPRMRRTRAMSFFLFSTVCNAADSIGGILSAPAERLGVRGQAKPSLVPIPGV